MFHQRLAEDDVARALHRGDDEVLGRLAHEAAGTLGELGRHRDDVVREHFRVLRAAGLVDDDLAVDEQIHVWGAMARGSSSPTARVARSRRPGPSAPPP